jgi:hypothetical protein
MELLPMSQELTRARVYRNIDLPQEWLGLEPFDALGLGAVAWLLMLVNRGGLGWNLVALGVAYATVRVAKRGKPEGHTTTLIRFYVRSPFSSAAAPDRKARAFEGGKPPQRAKLAEPPTRGLPRGAAAPDRKARPFLAPSPSAGPGGRPTCLPCTPPGMDRENREEIR